MRVLVACEESQAVCKEFRVLGHEAFSADILECSGGHPEWHILGDVVPLVDGDCYFVTQDGNGHKQIGQWDLLIAHPPCTYLTNSGVCWLTGKNAREGRWDQLNDGAKFFLAFLNAKCDRICVENPIMHKYAKEIIGKSHCQLVQPYMFGHPERKATCFWLKNLPLLSPTKNVKSQMEKLPKKYQQRIHYVSPGKDRAKIRSKTFSGIAKAMAEQWGEDNWLEDL